MTLELDRSSIYFLGVDEKSLIEIQNVKPEIYERFFKPPYTDTLETPRGRVAWLREPDFSHLKSEYNPESLEYLKAVIKEMHNNGVPKGTIHIYRQTLILEQLE